MEEMNEKRLQQRQIERAQTGFYLKWIEAKREHFEYADTMLWQMQYKNEEDLILLGHKVNEWYGKAKDDNKKQFEEFLLALFRIQSYCNQIETLSKESYSKMIMEQKSSDSTFSKMRKENLEMQLELKKVKSELENAKKEIEFHSSTGQ